MVVQVKVACPSCQAKLKLASESNPLGKLIKCTKCRSTFRCLGSQDTSPALKPVAEMFTFNCVCGASLKVHVASEGKKIKCPKCKGINICRLTGKNSSTVHSNHSPKLFTFEKKAPSNILAKAETKPIFIAQESPNPVPPASVGDGWGVPPATRIVKQATKPRRDYDEEASAGILKWCLFGILVLLLGFGGYHFFNLYSVPSTGIVTGKVYFGNAPLKSGQVAFLSKNGVPITSPINPDGSYEVKGIQYGEVILTVVQQNPDYKDGAMLRKLAKGKNAAIPTVEAKMNILPDKYGTPTTSPLRFNMEKGCDSHDIRLEKE